MLSDLTWEQKQRLIVWSYLLVSSHGLLLAMIPNLVLWLTTKSRGYRNKFRLCGLEDEGDVQPEFDMNLLV
ncbi:hypothetical protein [Coleofasciculus sp. LEGE 07081]|uniref:hypothetical protein n=1 Tax=Coleofasciculus sp. LEGE 07081 TaxID=2777967 RepID=UPI001D145130|nr:hypothetical protein [Coleofasciculus sp. LEGE 07081]